MTERSRAPLIDECYANLECKAVDEEMIARYSLFILEVLKAWIDPARKDPRRRSVIEEETLLWLPVIRSGCPQE